MQVPNRLRASSRRCTLAIALGLGVLLAGCAASIKPEPAPVLEPERASSRDPHVGVAGVSVEGRPIEYRRFVAGSRTVMIIATIHGNEPAGTPLLETLTRRLTAEPSLYEGRQVILVPVANPDGHASGSRHNARDVDLNRNFPADNFAARPLHGDNALSEPESRALHDLIDRYRPDAIVSIHQPLACVDYDGPARGYAQTLAAQGPLSVRKLGARPGSLGAWAGELQGIPTITLELPRGVQHEPADQLWSRYGPMLLTAIHERNADAAALAADVDTAAADETTEAR